jgi:hypothetical protein
VLVGQASVKKENVMLQPERKKIMGRLLIAGALTAMVPSWAASTAGTVAGSVIDDSGRPVGGARVLISQALPAPLRQFTPPPVIAGPSVTMVATDSNGIFSVAGLPDGQYVACAEVSAPGLLDPCHWAASAPTFTVSAGQATADIKITMARGAVVPIHVDDPLALLQPVTESSIASDFQVHLITNKGLHHNASVQASSATSRDLAVTVPFDTAVTLRVMTNHHLIVNDQTGHPAPAAGTSVTAVSGVPLPSFSYVVAGTL